MYISNVKPAIHQKTSRQILSRKSGEFELEQGIMTEVYY